MDLTQLIQKAKAGDTQARADLLQAAYDDLRQLAVGRMADERQNHTLTSTALVHEVALKMLDDHQVPVDGRGAFFAYASKAMRNLLIDHARGRGRQKRGGDRERLSFDDALSMVHEQGDHLLELHEALDNLASIDPRKAQVVEMRYFGGLSNAEVAESLEVSVATVKRDWDVAKTWLYRELSTSSESPEEA